uniref:C2 domain-containing protein n=1 Tax=Xenopus tropicalis TaxID=8364 RepID=A0A803J8G1_XENTR
IPGLQAKDLSSSDPYVVIHGGGTTVQTKVIQKNLNPQWNETFEVSEKSCLSNWLACYHFL